MRRIFKLSDGTFLSTDQELNNVKRGTYEEVSSVDNVFTFTRVYTGSGGNLNIVKYKDTVLLLDCGVGIRKVEQALREHNLKASDISAIIISHAHKDHDGLRDDQYAKLCDNVCRTPSDVKALDLDLELEPFINMHGMLESMGLVISAGDKTYCWFTDVNNADNAPHYPYDHVFGEVDWNKEGMKYVVDEGIYTKSLATRIIEDHHSEERMIKWLDGRSISHDKLLVLHMSGNSLINCKFNTERNYFEEVINDL